MANLSLVLVVIAMILFFVLAFRLVVVTRIDLSSFAFFLLTLAWLLSNPVFVAFFRR